MDLVLAPGLRAALKAATRHLAGACAGPGRTGPQRAADLTGAAAGTVSRWCGDGYPDTIPLDAAMLLTIETQSTALGNVFAALAGHALAPICESEARAAARDMVDDLVRLTGSHAEVSAELAGARRRRGDARRGQGGAGQDRAASRRAGRGRASARGGRRRRAGGPAMMRGIGRLQSLADGKESAGIQADGRRPETVGQRPKPAGTETPAGFVERVSTALAGTGIAIDDVLATVASVADLYGITVAELVAATGPVKGGGNVKGAVYAALRDLGLTRQEVAAMFGCAASTVTNVVWRAGLAGVRRDPRPRPRIAGRPDTERAAPAAPAAPAAAARSAPAAPPRRGFYDRFEVGPGAARPDCRPDPLQWAADGRPWRGCRPGEPIPGHSSLDAAGAIAGRVR